jgi:hypothetical protein
VVLEFHLAYGVVCRLGARPLVYVYHSGNELGDRCPH